MSSVKISLTIWPISINPHRLRGTKSHMADPDNIHLLLFDWFGFNQTSKYASNTYSISKADESKKQP